jgi:Ca2+-binding EF-hand superfamily protein
MNFHSRLDRSLLAAAGLSIALVAGAGEGKMQKMDADGDGMITAEEHSAGARQMFQKMDSDADGRVTTTEMDAMHAQMKPGDAGKPQMSSADKIKTIDTDSDGVVTAAEHEGAAREMFGKMDVNQDGKLSADEMRAGHAKPAAEGTR